MRLVTKSVNFVTSWKRYYSKVILESVLSPTWSSKSQMLPRYDQRELVVEWHIKDTAGLFCLRLYNTDTLYFYLTIFLFYPVCHIICLKSEVLFQCYPFYHVNVAMYNLGL